jgi:hypothetical protein
VTALSFAMARPRRCSHGVDEHHTSTEMHSGKRRGSTKLQPHPMDHSPLFLTLPCENGPVPDRIYSSPQGRGYDVGCTCNGGGTGRLAWSATPSLARRRGAGHLLSQGDSSVPPLIFSAIH